MPLVGTEDADRLNRQGLHTWLAAALLQVWTAPELLGMLGDVGVPGYFGGVDQACVKAAAPLTDCNSRSHSSAYVSSAHSFGMYLNVFRLCASHLFNVREALTSQLALTSSLPVCPLPTGILRRAAMS